MATIVTDNDFVNACNHLIVNNLLPVQGARFIDRAARKVWDERMSGNVDITPDTPTLESALDSANTTIANQATKETAKSVMLAQAKEYLSNQLQNATPNVTTIYNTVKAFVDGNATLSQMLTNQINLFQTAYVVTINLATPTALDRTRYIICCQLVLATIA